MATILELSQNRQAALAKADYIISAAENAGRPLTNSESAEVDVAMAEAQDTASRIATLEKRNTLKSQFTGGIGPIAAAEDGEGRVRNAHAKPKALSAEYAEAFRNFLGTNGQRQDAALYEGSNPAGGFAVPIVVDNQFVPLAPPEMSIRSISTVIPTASDIKIPRQTVFSTSALKAESGATTNAFTESQPVIDSFTLSAFMAGILQKLSWELLQDVPAFQSFCVNDMLTAQQTLEEGLYVSGTGIGQAQGLLGNVGPGVSGAVADANGHLVSLDSLEDLMGTVRASYLDNAHWLMNRTTSTAIRAAQRQQNLYNPVLSRSGDRDYLYGYPVAYCASMPSAAPGSSPVLFGDFKAGYMIGDRGGNGINVKILDQPFATVGQTALLAFRRTDGRVRRSEAIQQLTLHT